MGVLLFLYKTKRDVNGAYFLIASLAMAIVCYWQQGLENTIAALIVVCNRLCYVSKSGYDFFGYHFLQFIYYAPCYRHIS